MTGDCPHTDTTPVGPGRVVCHDCGEMVPAGLVEVRRIRGQLAARRDGQAGPGKPPGPRAARPSGDSDNRHTPSA